MRIAQAPSPYLATISDHWSNHVLTSGDGIGAQAGYGTLADAMRAAAAASAGVEQAAVAVTESAAGRFLLTQINGVAYIAGHPGTELPLAPFTLIERLELAHDAQRLAALSWRRDRTGTALPVSQALRAIVDGATTLRISSGR